MHINNKKKTSFVFSFQKKSQVDIINMLSTESYQKCIIKKTIKKNIMYINLKTNNAFPVSGVSSSSQ